MGYRQPSSRIAPARRSGTDPWSDALDRLVRHPGMVRPVFQPIVDLRRGVVSGYEMLARFAGPPSASPDVWFAEAGSRGLAPELEARMVRIGLEARAALPPNTFLTINLDPAHLGEPVVQAALARHRRLNGVVLELTEHSAVDDERLEAALPPLRERGAMVAIDGVGAGVSGLHRIAAVRPHFVKVDRGLIGGLDGDAAQREVVESLGAVASRIDAWVVGEGIERAAELDALMRLRVPLGQGYALGRPQPAMVSEIELCDWIKERSDSGAAPAQLWHDQPPLHLDCWIVEARRRLSEEPGVAHLAVADELGRPVGIVSRARFARGDQQLAPALCTGVDEDPARLARRAMARPPETRFDPVLCCDDAGRYLGTIEIERLVEALASA